MRGEAQGRAERTKIVNNSITRLEDGRYRAEMDHPMFKEYIEKKRSKYSGEKEEGAEWGERGVGRSREKRPCIKREAQKHEGARQV